MGRDRLAVNRRLTLRWSEPNPATQNRRSGLVPATMCARQLRGNRGPFGARGHAEHVEQPGHGGLLGCLTVGHGEHLPV